MMQFTIAYVFYWVVTSAKRGLCFVMLGAFSNGFTVLLPLRCTHADIQTQPGVTEHPVYEHLPELIPLRGLAEEGGLPSL